jgi:ubiquinone/menaquinone biosynthesis C-methylase UbiE
LAEDRYAMIAAVSSERLSSAAPGWLLDELHHAGRENLDEAHVGRYDAKEDAGAHSEVALLKSAGLGPESVVLEFGPGTGQFTIEAARKCSRVIAVDVSEPMLRALRAKAAGAGVENVEIVHGGFLTYEHTGTPTDFIYTRLALHHLPDFWKAVALARMRAMLRADGVLRLADVVYSFDPSDAGQRIEEWCASGGETVEADWTRTELEEHVRDEHSTFAWLLEPMIERAGFQITHADIAEDGMFASYLLRAA